MYSDRNFKTKKQLKEAVAAGEKIGVFQPGGIFGGGEPQANGKACVEGPHYPEPHKWHASVTLENGFITKVS